MLGSCAARCTHTYRCREQKCAQCFVRCHAERHMHTCNSSISSEQAFDHHIHTHKHSEHVAEKTAPTPAHVHGSGPAVLHASGCCSHDHFEGGADWGPVRGGIRSSLEWLGLLPAARAWGSSIKVAAASCASLVLSLLFTYFVNSYGHAALSAASGLLLAVTFTLSGLPSFVEALFQVLNGTIDTHVLTFAAVIGTLVLRIPMEGAALLVLFHISHTLEDHFSHAAMSGLTRLIDEVPQQATILELNSDGKIDWASQQNVDASTVPAGALIAVKPGEILPLDGRIYDGRALIGQENITGESLPVPRALGELVQAGGLVHDGTLVVRTTRTFGDSTPARIAQLTAEAARNKPRLEAFLDRIANKWSMVVMLAVAVMFTILVGTGLPIWGVKGALYRSLGLLTAAAPCALVLTPLAYVCAMAVLTRHGVLVRGSSVIDAVREVQCIALDKTGTVSRGQLLCSQIKCCIVDGAMASSPNDQGAREARALSLAAAMSLRSQHPVCAAVLRHHHRSREHPSSADKTWQASEDALPQLQGFGVVPGAGMWGKTDRGKDVLFGSIEYVSPSLTPTQRDALKAQIESNGSGRVVSILLEGEGLVQEGTHNIVNGSNNKYAASGMGERQGGRMLQAAVFVFADVAERDSKASVSWLRQHGQQLMVLTGDNSDSASVIAKDVGITADELQSNLSPADKAARIVQQQAQGTVVMMVGDGVNDSPALAAADVGVAIASGADSIVTESSSVIVLREASKAAESFQGAVGAVALLLHVAWATRRLVIQNLAIAIGSIALAAVPVLAGATPLWLTVLLHEGSSVLVALNCMRLLALKHPLGSDSPSLTAVSVA